MLIPITTVVRELDRVCGTPGRQVRSVLRLLIATRPFSLSSLEGAAVHELGFPAPLVWNELRALVRTGDVIRTSLGEAGSSGRRSVIYSVSSLSECEQVHYRRCFARKRQLFDPNELGKLGESYAYWLLWSSQLFNVGRKQRLGFNRNKAGKHPADLLIRYRDKTLDQRIGKLLVEFKNTREIHSPKSPIFAELITKALSHGAQPMLFVPYLTDEARSLCRAFGIVVLELRRQLLPTKFKKPVKELRDIIDSQPFEFLTARLYQAGPSELARRDLDRVLDPRWVSDAAPVWRSMVPSLEKYGAERSWDEKYADGAGDIQQSFAA